MTMRFKPVQLWLADGSTRRFVWSVVKPYRTAIALLLLSGFFSTLAETAGIGVIVLLVNLIVDPQNAFSVAGGGVFGRVYSFLAAVPVHGLVLVLLAFLLARSLAIMVYMQQSSLFRHGVSEELRNAIYRRCFEMPYQDVIKTGSGDLASLVSLDSWSLADACITTVQLIIGVGSVGILVAILFVLSWPLALAALGLTILLLFVVHLVWQPANAAGKAVTLANADLHGEMLAGLQSMRTIRAHALEPAALGWFAATSHNASQAFVEIDSLYSRIRPVGEISAVLLLLAVGVVANLLGVAPAAAVAALLLLYRIQPRVREIENAVLMLAGHTASLAKVKTLIDQPCDAANDAVPAAVAFARLHDRIEFRNVSFAYGEGSDRAVLDGFSATIAAGEVVAITGPSGVGKTTLTALLLRLLDAQSGEVLVDGTPISKLDRGQWLSRIGSAGQDLVPLAGTIADNISLRDPSMSHATIEAAARSACLAEFVDSLPNGYETLVGEGGIGLSGGQRQRLAIARVIARDPDIIILDEATSAIDRAMAEQIMQSMLSRFQASTIIIISHDAGIVSYADRTIALDPQ